MELIDYGCELVAGYCHGLGAEIGSLGVAAGRESQCDCALGKARVDFVVVR
jgi:hypothetical protein